MKQKDLKEKEQIQETNGQETMDINTDENVSGSTHLNEPVAEESELEKLKQQVDELNDKYLRQVAEFDNFKRRNAKERIEMIQTAGKEVITDLLEVLDDTERAEKQLETTDDINIARDGVKLVFSKFKSKLQSKGLKPMDAVNKEFNPDLHEAITEIDGGEDMKGKVVAEIEKGYYLNDKIIRFAKVVVGK